MREKPYAILCERDPDLKDYPVFIRLGCECGRPTDFDGFETRSPANKPHDCFKFFSRIEEALAFIQTFNKRRKHASSANLLESESV